MDKRISELKLQSVIGSMRLEGFDLTGEEIETCRKIMNGQIDVEEACQKVIIQYLKRK